MSLSVVLSRTLGAALITFFALSGTQALAQAANPAYVTVQPAQPSDTTGKTEVLEFFSYSCPHCAAIEPLMRTWAEKQPDNVVVRQVPVAFNASMADQQKLFYVLEALGRTDLHPLVFDTIHKQRKRIFDAKSITDWAVEQGIDRKKFESTFNSFGINSKINRANELAKNYGVDSTPSIAVGGQFLTSPALAGGYQEAVDQTQRLLDQLAAN